MKGKNQNRCCTFCGQEFQLLRLLYDHVRTHTGEKPFECKYCKKFFRSSSILKSHEKNHTGIKPYSCTECSQSFHFGKDFRVHKERHENKLSLSSHFKTHSGELPYNCNFCNRRFRYSRNFTQHLRSHSTHMAEKLFKCEICSSYFNNQGELQIHSFIHKREWPLKCNICEKTFIRPANLRKHSLAHSSGEKKRLFKCSYCPLTFNSSANIRQHYSSHTRELPLKCSLCPLKYARQWNLLRHVRRDHSKITKDELPGKSQDMQIARVSPCAAKIVDKSRRVTGNELIRRNLALDLKSNSVEEKSGKMNIEIYFCKECQCAYFWKEELCIHYSVCHDLPVVKLRRL